MREQIVSTYGIVRHGCDPELFFERNGQIVGSEKVITPGMLPGVVLDGVQVELNPRSYMCRAHLGVDIANAFRTLRGHLENMKDISVSFTSVVEVSKEELDSLSAKSRELGCAPSDNFYHGATSLNIDPTTFRTRSAGGHVHVGLPETMKKRALRLVPIFDSIIGNTCVMIDRDPMAVERRKTYGRAGEHRLPSHGIEYRTLSNFWLRSYPLMGFVMGLSRLAAGILKTTLDMRPPMYEVPPVYYPYAGNFNWDAEAKFLKMVDLASMEKAINENDLELAKKNYQNVKEFIYNHVPWGMDCGLDPGILNEFDFFLKKVEEKGITYWFPENPIDHWCSIYDGHNHGWESFLGGRVRQEMLKQDGLDNFNLIAEHVEGERNKWLKEVENGENK